MADPAVGDKLINDAGTVVEVVNVIEGEELRPGTIPADRVAEWVAAGYEPVTEDTIIPVQANQASAQ